MITTDDISQSYANLKVARQDYRNAQKLYLGEKRKLDRQIRLAIREGRIAGKNPDERKAMAEVMFQEYFDTLDDLSEKAEDAKCELDLAWMDVNEVRALLRRDEIAAKIGDDDEADYQHGG